MSETAYRMVDRVQSERNMHQDREEIAALAAVLLQFPRRVVALEIGFGQGGTHLLWRQLYGLVLSIDIRPDAFAQSLPWPGSTFLLGNSADADTREAVLQVLDTHWLGKLGKDGRHIDLLFIDGDHNYSAVKSDYEMYSPLVRPGGVVAFHDACTEGEGYGVARFLREDLSDHSFVTIHHHHPVGLQTGIAYEVMA